MPSTLYRSDKQLIQRVLAGERKAFDDFFEGHFPALYRFALRRLGDADQAADVAQGAMVKAIGKLSTYRAEAALTSWLFTFCRHEMSSHLRQQQKLPQQLALVDDLPEVRAALDTLASPEDEGPEAALQRKELIGWVHATLDYLPPHYGQVLEWKYLQELPVKEIARRLQIAPKAAESLLTRARQAFRDGFCSVQQGSVQQGSRPGLGTPVSGWGASPGGSRS